MSTPASQKSDHAYVNAFNMIPGIGAHKLFLLSHYFDSFSTAWHASKKELIAAGLSAKIATIVTEQRVHIDPSNAWNMLSQNNISLLAFTDFDFPQKLKMIQHPPFCLYVRGNISVLSTPSVAVVGSRKISEYGVRATSFLTHDLVHNDITIISGLALGTDALAHRTALENNGLTIAIVAGGVDDASLAPRSHLSLAHKILTHDGAILSEYPIGTEPSRGTFPARNRLMAGLADVTLIVEAAKSSGTLITATHASAYGKKIFALPSSIFSTHAHGSNELIKSGIATPLFATTDLLEIFHIKNTPHPTTTKAAFFSHPQHKTVFDTIAACSDGIQINHIIKKTGFDTTTASTALTMLEIDGVIKNIGNQTYISL